MRILLDINHPADVHQFKHVIKKLMKRYPNALWRKFRGKDNEQGYELEV